MTTTTTDGTAGNGNDPPRISEATKQSYRDAQAALEQYKKDERVNCTSAAQRQLWQEAMTIALDFAEKHKAFDSDDPIVDAIATESEHRFKGKMNSDQKKSLKREFEALKFGQIHSMKIRKYEAGVNDRTANFIDAQRTALLEEIRSLKKENLSLKSDNQSLSTSCHQISHNNKAKEEDLKIQVLAQLASKFAEKKKIAPRLFSNYGFAISKSILTKTTKVIQKANDFGPKSKKAGVPFFKAFFKELSKSPADAKIVGMEKVKNHHMVYNDVIDKAVAADKENDFTGHFLDTKENRNLIWYGMKELGNEGIASQLVKAFNATRSNESSKKYRPAIGMSNS
jgi:hypothetical protein